MRQRLLYRWLIAALIAVTATSPLVRPEPPHVAQAGNPSLELLAPPLEASLGVDATLAVDDAPAVGLAVDELGDIAVKAFAQAVALPAAEWDLELLAQSLDYDPNRAFEFVRDRIALDPYPGILRGAEGTLAARAGSADDRALLLSALLDEMLVPHRFAFAELDDQAADAVLARAFEGPVEPLGTPNVELVPNLDADALARRARRDYARLRDALPEQLLTFAHGAPEADRAIVRHHTWVQTAFGAIWRDLDPTMPDSVPGSTLAPAAQTLDELPADRRQTLSLRLIVETLDSSGLGEQTVLQRELDPIEASRSEIWLYFQPELDTIGGGILTALSGDEPWIPVLLVDGAGEPGTAFRAGGRATDIFGDPTDAPELASVRLIVERHVPGVAPEQAVRTILDRVPREARSSSTLTPELLLPMGTDRAGPAVLGQVFHVMVSTGGTSSRMYAAARGLVADFMASELLDEGRAADYSFADQLWPLAVADQTLVVASERAIVPAMNEPGVVRAFVGTPRVYLTSFGPDPLDPESLGFTIDLLLDGVDVLTRDPAAPTKAYRKLWYGAAQTALETEVSLLRAWMMDPGTSELGGVSLAMSQPLTVVRPGDTGSLPATSPEALRSAVAGGLLAVIPGDPGQATTWWTIDATSGATRSVLDPGLGGVRNRRALQGSATGPRTADTVYGKHHGTGAGGRGFRQKLPGQGRNNWGGDRGQWSPARHMPLPNGCKPTQEYVMIIGCVSVPTAHRIRVGVGLGVAFVVALAIGVFLATR